jgi:hypothetical protein
MSVLQCDAFVPMFPLSRGDVGAGSACACYDASPLEKPKEPAMRHVPFVAFDFCDFVTYTLAGIAFALCLYMEVGH